MAAELDWERIGDAVAQRRAECGFRRQEEAAEAAGIGVTTWRQIEGAKQKGYRPLILTAVANALGWPPDALLRIGRGESPAAVGDSARIDQLEADVAEIKQMVEQIQAAPPRRRSRAPGGAGS